MLINLICVGNKMPGWVNEGYQEYAKRLNRDVRIKLVELELAKRSKTSSAENLKASEAKKILQAIPKANQVVVLDVNGSQWSTEKLSQRLTHWLQSGKDVSLIIGGPDGLEQSLVQAADERWSLSKLTFPHPLVRIVIAEQIYRAWSLLNNHPYHRQ